VNNHPLSPTFLFSSSQPKIPFFSSKIAWLLVFFADHNTTVLILY